MRSGLRPANVSRTEQTRPSQAKLRRVPFLHVPKAMALFSLMIVTSGLMFAGDLDPATLSDALRHPSWNYGVQLSGGSTVVQVSAPSLPTSDRAISNLAVALHLGRVLTQEHGNGWTRGTFEWDVNLIPIEIFWVLGNHYSGGFELLGPRWNFTGHRRKAVPFVGLSGGMLFSPSNFPPGDTSKLNFSAALDAGTHLFLTRHRQSFDVAARVQHVSNAYLGRSDPGVPVSLQLTLGYSWY